MKAMYENLNEINRMKTQESNTPVIGYYTESYHVIRHHKKLSPVSKLIFEEICTLSKLKGYCFASYKYFCETFNISLRSFRRYIKELKNSNLICYHNNHIIVNYEQIEHLSNKLSVTQMAPNGCQKWHQDGDTDGTYNNIINKTTNNSGENIYINKESKNINSNELNNKDYTKYKKTTYPANDENDNGDRFDTDINNTGITNDTTIPDYVLEDYNESEDDFYEHENDLPIKEEPDTPANDNELTQEIIDAWEQKLKVAGSNKKNNNYEDGFNYGKI